MNHTTEPGQAEVKGLDLCRHYYFDVVRPALESLRLDDGEPLLSVLACGLAGEGSDCFGFDDALSRDHDWGPGVALWFDEQDARIDAERLSRLYRGLPKAYAGFERLEMPEAAGRVGPVSWQSFYKRLLGRATLPARNREWLALPESALATATNGAVFEDRLGQFSALRRGFLVYYPEPVRLKKIAARLAVIGQAGQYNLPRCLQRGDWIGARYALNEFTQLYMSAVHLFSFKYRPYYKWAARSMAELEGWTAAYEGLMQLSLYDLAAAGAVAETEGLIAELCEALLQAVKALDICAIESDFLPHQAAVLQNAIPDDDLRTLPLMYG